MTCDSWFHYAVILAWNSLQTNISVFVVSSYFSGFRFICIAVFHPLWTWSCCLPVEEKKSVKHEDLWNKFSSTRTDRWLWGNVFSVVWEMWKDLHFLHLVDTICCILYLDLSTVSNWANSEWWFNSSCIYFLFLPLYTGQALWFLVSGFYFLCAE